MVLMKIGRVAFGFVLVVSIVSSVFVAALLASGIPPPDVIWFASSKPSELIKSLNSTATSGQAPTTVGLGVIAEFFYNFGLSMISGMPILFYKIASIVGIPSLAPAALMLGTLLQGFALYYIIKVFWSFIAGGSSE